MPEIIRRINGRKSIVIWEIINKIFEKYLMNAVKLCMIVIMSCTDK